MVKRVATSLEFLKSQFEEGHKRYPSLFHAIGMFSDSKVDNQYCAKCDPKKRVLREFWERNLPGKNSPFQAGFWGIGKNLRQHYCFYGSQEGYSEFSRLADSAGQCLFQLPKKLLPNYPLNKSLLNDATRKHSINANSTCYWMNQLYRLAFKNPDTPLKVKNIEWLSAPNVREDYDPRFILTFETEDGRSLENWKPAIEPYTVCRFPVFFCVTLSLNVFQSSAYAINLILEDLKEREKKSSKRKRTSKTASRGTRVQKKYLFVRKTETLTCPNGKSIVLPKREAWILEKLIKNNGEPWRPLDKERKPIKASLPKYLEAKSGFHALKDRLEKNKIGLHSALKKGDFREGWYLDRAVQIVLK